MRKLMATMLLGASALAPVQAGAETLRVSGVYPANVDLPGYVEALSVVPFGGDAGRDAELAITDLLGGVTINGERYFRLTSGAGYGSGSSDAVLRGTVYSDVYEERVQPRIVTRCIERNDKGKCIERKKRRIPCRELTVRMDPRIVLIAADGTQLYSRRAPVYESARYCRNDAHIPSDIDMGNRLIDRIARQVRADLAPVQFSRGYRIMEKRKGLGKADRAAFKQAIRLTKRSASEACDAFGSLYQTNPNHLSVVYNMGLCAEAFGELGVAERFYADARSIKARHSYHRKGTNRIAARYRANAQLAARERANGSYLGMATGAP